MAMVGIADRRITCHFILATIKATKATGKILRWTNDYHTRVLGVDHLLCSQIRSQLLSMRTALLQHITHG